MCSNTAPYPSCLTYLWCATLKYPVLSVVPWKDKIMKIMNKNVLKSVVEKKKKKFSSDAKIKFISTEYIFMSSVQ